jgi:hypothetical protein
LTLNDFRLQSRPGASIVAMCLCSLVGPGVQPRRMGRVPFVACAASLAPYSCPSTILGVERVERCQNAGSTLHCWRCQIALAVDRLKKKGLKVCHDRINNSSRQHCPGSTGAVHAQHAGVLPPSCLNRRQCELTFVPTHICSP